MHSIFHINERKNLSLIKKLSLNISFVQFVSFVLAPYAQKKLLYCSDSINVYVFKYLNNSVNKRNWQITPVFSTLWTEIMSDLVPLLFVY